MHQVSIKYTPQRQAEGMEI